MKKCFTYLISHPESGYFYIGKTNNIKSRISSHLYDSRKRPTTFINFFLKKYPDAVFEILEEVNCEYLAFLYEKMYIGLFKSWGLKLMNITDGGEGASGYSHTNETKQYISKIHKNMKYSEESKNIMSVKKLGNKHFMYGKHQSDDHKFNLAYSKCKHHFPVNVYSLDGVFLNRFDSHVIAKYTIYDGPSFSTGEILSNCRRKQISCHGYIFQFVDDDKIEECLKRCSESRFHNDKPILQYDMGMNLIEKHKNSYQAAKVLNKQNIKIGATDIRKCCDGIYKQQKGFIWRYEYNPL